MYSKNDIELIKKQVDMLAYLENQGLTFQHSGTAYKGLCPIHNERSPSFYVRPLENTFHCFGCGVHGDIFALVQEMEQLSFVGAVQELAAYANIELVHTEEDEVFKKKQRLYQICAIASKYFRQEFLSLPEDHPGKTNLSARNLLHPMPSSVNGYAADTDELLGYAKSSGLIDLLLKGRFSIDEIKEAGLAVDRENGGGVREKFRERLMWTVTDIAGKPIGFSGRKVHETDLGPKYLNSPQTPLYNKSKTLLNLSTAKKEIVQKQTVYVVEGQTDVMAVRAVGLENVVASCGTAFGTDHANILSHLSNIGKQSEHFKIVFCFDADDAGRKAAKKVFEANKSMHLNSYVVNLVGPDGDPCDFRKNQGEQALYDALTQTQINIVEFILKEELKQWDVRTPEGQSNFIRKAREILSLITDPIQHAHYLRRVALWTGLSYESLMSSMRASAPAAVKQEAPVATASTLTGAEKTFIATALQYSEEIKPYISKHRIINNTFFPLSGEHGYQLLWTAVNGDGIDYNNPEITELLHTDLKIVPERKEDIIASIVKTFLFTSYTAEVNQLNTEIALLSENPTAVPDQNLLGQILMKQMQLKTKYSI